MNGKKKTVQWLLVITLTAAGLYFSLYNVEFSEVFAALRHARWGWVGASLLCAITSFIFRAYRWRLLLDDHLSLPATFGLINIGYLVSGIFPFRAGDPARAVAASLRTPVSAMAALSTVVVERTLDMLTIGIVMVLTLPFVALGGDSLLPGIIGGSAAVVAFVTLLAMARWPDKVEALARAVLERLPLGDPDRWLAPLRGILDGLQALRSPRKGFWLAVYSTLIWAMVIIYYIGLFHALPDLAASLTGEHLLASAVLTWATALGMAAPTQSGLGSYHIAAQLALTLPFAVGLELATSYSWLAWAGSYTIGVGFGAVSLLVMGVSLKEIRGVGHEG